MDLQEQKQWNAMYQISSMNNWFPKIKKHETIFKFPKTKIYHIDEKDLTSGVDFFPPEVNKKLIDKIIKDEWEFPLFIRTDQTSGKHDYKDTCYVESLDKLDENINNLICVNRTTNVFGLPFTSLIVREFIELDWKFKAFWGKMPVAPEVRIFVRDEKVECIHPYWFEDAINGMTDQDDWRHLLIEINQRAEKDYFILGKNAIEFNKVVEGYWSVDYALGKDGEWYLIDCAHGDASYHYPHEEASK